MLLGGVAYLYPFKFSKRNSRLLELVGVFFIVGTYFIATPETPWPGYASIFPVVGAFFIIQAQQNRSFLTCNIVFQKIGKWSYSIYLWHWPLAVAIYWYSLSAIYSYVGILLSVLLGFISYKYIESFKFKRKFTRPTEYLKFKPLYFTVFVSLLGFTIAYSNGLSYRVPDDIKLKNINAMKAIDDWDYPQPNLKVGNSEIRFIKGSTDKNILFIGASHIEQTYPYVKNNNGEYNVYYLTVGGCFVAPSSKHPKHSCKNIQDYKPLISSVGFDKIVSSIYLLDTRLSKEQESGRDELEIRVAEYKEFLGFAKKNTNEIFVISGEPIGKEFDPKQSTRNNLRHYITKEEAKSNYKEQYKLLKDIGNMEGIKIIDPIEHLCDDVCMVLSSDLEFYYKDKTHMRPWYSKGFLGYLGPIFN